MKFGKETCFCVKLNILYLNSVQLQGEEKSISVAADASTEPTELSEPIRATKPEAEDTGSQSSISMAGVTTPGTPQLHTERCTEPTSPPKTPSSVSLAESMQSATHSKSATHIPELLLCILYET